VIGFNIEQAEDQGYFVAGTRQDAKKENTFIKCAGSLEDCLKYMRREFLTAEVTDAAIDIKTGEKKNPATK
jgi:hypothetical protein